MQKSSNVVVATTKVHIFKQITTEDDYSLYLKQLLLLPQRYIFSSKSQLSLCSVIFLSRCCCYHKGTYFQANHNQKMVRMRLILLLLLPQRYIFSSKSQPSPNSNVGVDCCCCYHKGTYFQANHNWTLITTSVLYVVVATTKVHIFKQITTMLNNFNMKLVLLLLPQRYIFSSKSQPKLWQTEKVDCCCCYHKGTYFQANHN